MMRCLHLDHAPCFPYIRSLPLLRHRGRCLGGLERSSIPRNRLSPAPTLDHMTPRGLLPETTNITAGRSHDEARNAGVIQTLLSSRTRVLLRIFDIAPLSPTYLALKPQRWKPSPNNRDARRCFPSLNETINALDLARDRSWTFAFASSLLATTVVCFFQFVFTNCRLMYYEGLGY